VTQADSFDRRGPRGFRDDHDRPLENGAIEEATLEAGSTGATGLEHADAIRREVDRCVRFPASDYFRKLRNRNTGVPIFATVAPLSVSE